MTRDRVALVLLALGSFAASLLTARTLFPLYSVNRDDSVYVAMARLIRRGTVTLPPDVFPFFQPWASGLQGGRVVLKYTPPWPAVLAAADLLTGSTRIGLAVTAAATVVALALLTREVTGDRATGVVAGALLGLSPLFVFQTGTYLPYVFELLLGLTSAALLLSGVRLRSTPRLVGAGAVMALAAFARPYDAVLFITPFLLLVLVGLGRLPTTAPGWTRFGVAVRLFVGALPVGIAALVFDAVVMSSPLRLPYLVTGPQDGFGFGRKGVFPEETIAFTPADGGSGALRNLQWLPSWVFGGVLVVALAAVGLARTRGAARWAVAAPAVVFPLGYLAFWGPYAIGYLWRGVQTFGPFYYLPMLVPLAAFAAVCLVGLWRARRVVVRPLTALLLAVMVALTAAALPDKVAANAAIRNDYEGLRRFVADQHLQHAVLLLPVRGNRGFISSSPFLENDPALRQPVLYAQDRGAENFALVDRFPDRSLYELSEDIPRGRTTGGRLSIDRLRLEESPSPVLRLRLTNPTDRPLVSAYATDGRTTWSRALDQSSVPGRGYDVTWSVSAGSGAAPDGSLAETTVRLPAGTTSGVLAVGLELRSPGRTESPGRRWERRIPYRVVDGGARVQLLRPGQGWAYDDGSNRWTPSTSDQVVAELG